MADAVMGTRGGMRALGGVLVDGWRRRVADGKQRHRLDQGEAIPHGESTFGKDPLRRAERTGVVGEMPSRDDCGPLKPLSTQAFLRYADLERHHPGALSGELGDEAYEKHLVHAHPCTFELRPGTLSSSRPRPGVRTVLEERQFEAHVPIATLRACPPAGAPGVRRGCRSPGPPRALAECTTPQPYLARRSHQPPPLRRSLANTRA